MGVGRQQERTSGRLPCGGKRKVLGRTTPGAKGGESALCSTSPGFSHRALERRRIWARPAARRVGGDRQGLSSPPPASPLPPWQASKPSAWRPRTTTMTQSPPPSAHSPPPSLCHGATRSDRRSPPNTVHPISLPHHRWCTAPHGDAAAALHLQSLGPEAQRGCNESRR
ncbi:hypothetical protein E2562_021264 [Oryza meyeriana var. granulata]|uniref:Uncharacterized protein n=1 Tax=Oryza meyeriana var. granulata TaxID=110450 RepID=A0A6G1E066_9ORYZ|nr:hypothetical protein E2562_021264 [Oryza meyeriana var. granulata]KAF0917770.1 hypothetical protein E2562_021264 [Oryza meyeriana var. granulata]KAF0917771.1 hypothetical protein E2562_021264 [Oryza meyeriana var. granulata]KAF0917772.1 hypothetical protein E2562_021264 [Oryza meyeriana var. granulata]KAF0917773.1 hypothetical protein E2562_021264 [Oryza meyeriana var. granulata]